MVRVLPSPVFRVRAAAPDFIFPRYETGGRSEENLRFAHRLATCAKGWAAFTARRDRDWFAMWDYVMPKKRIMG